MVLESGEEDIIAPSTLVAVIHGSSERVALDLMLEISIIGVIIPMIALRSVIAKRLKFD